ncbi:hypothetical protein ABZP36_014037 [Zizania latifolia]
MERGRVVWGLVWMAAAAALVAAEPLPQYYNAIFSFGDSFSDTGNFVIINSGKLPNMPKFPPPYARCSNGRLVIDFLAEAFGVPLLPPSANTGTNFSQGANFAVMGATALDLQYFKDNNVWSIPPFNTSMNIQLGWFDEVKQTVCSSPQECREFFGKALFVFGEFGGNDYSFAWKADWSLEKVKTMVPKVVASMIGGIERLLDEGARHVVVPGNLPAGCIPITLTMYPSDDRSDYDPRTGCLKKYNSVALYHNAMLRIALDQLQRRRPDSRIVYADYYTPYIQFARTPHLYGQSPSPPSSSSSSVFPASPASGLVKLMQHSQVRASTIALDTGRLTTDMAVTSLTTVVSFCCRVHDRSATARGTAGVMAVIG